MSPFRSGLYNICLELATDLPGGVHLGLYLPRGEEWEDYLVLVPEPGYVEVEDTGNETIELRGMRFQFYTSSLTTGGLLSDQLYKKLRKLSLTLSNGDRILSGQKVSDAALLDPDRWHDATEVWLTVMVFEFFVQRQVIPV